MARASAWGLGDAGRRDERRSGEDRRRGDRRAPVRNALARPPPPHPVPTPRQLELLALLAAGMTQREAARRLGISFETVRSLNQLMYKRLGTRSLVETVVLALRRGWLELEP